jgi:hypothetical protein
MLTQGNGAGLFLRVHQQIVDDIAQFKPPLT